MILTGALHCYMTWSYPGEHTLYGLLSCCTEGEQSFLTVEGDVTAKHWDDFHSVYVVKMDKEGEVYTPTPSTLPSHTIPLQYIYHGGRVDR